MRRKCRGARRCACGGASRARSSARRPRSRGRTRAAAPPCACGGGPRGRAPPQTRRRTRHTCASAPRCASGRARDLLDAPTALAACCGFDLCHKYILYLYLYLRPEVPRAREYRGAHVARVLAGHLPRHVAGKKAPPLSPRLTDVAMCAVSPSTQHVTCVAPSHGKRFSPTAFQRAARHLDDVRAPRVRHVLNFRVVLILSPMRARARSQGLAQDRQHHARCPVRFFAHTCPRAHLPRPAPRSHFVCVPRVAACSPEDLKDMFGKYGTIGDVFIPRDRVTGGSRGFAFVRFLDKAAAEKAMEEMNGQRDSACARGRGRARGGRVLWVCLCGARAVVWAGCSFGVARASAHRARAVWAPRGAPSATVPLRRRRRLRRWRRRRI
jgi:hypothetical protein